MWCADIYFFTHMHVHNTPSRIMQVCVLRCDGIGSRVMRTVPKPHGTRRVCASRYTRADCRHICFEHTDIHRHTYADIHMQTYTDIRIQTHRSCSPEIMQFGLCRGSLVECFLATAPSLHMHTAHMYTHVCGCGHMHVISSDIFICVC